MNATARRPFTGEVTFARWSKGDRLAVFGLLTGYTALMARTLGNPLTEYHAFRQTQTAFVTRSFLQNGIDLAHPVVPIYGPSSQIPFEMPWYQALSALVAKAFRLSDVVALRTTSLAFTLVTAVFVFALTKRLAGRVASFAATAVFLFSPFTMQWGRAALIESFTVAMTLGWVCSVIRLEGETDVRSRYRILGALAGVLAATSKITTFVPWGIVALPSFVRDLRARRWRSAVATAASGGVSILSGLAWTRHADGVKAAGADTAWLASGRLQAFTFGTMQQRLSVSTWTTMLSRTARLALGPLLIVVIVVAAVRVRRTANKFDVLATASVPFIGFALFTNLYVVHDYYQVAIVPAVAIPAGIAIVAVGQALTPARKLLGVVGLIALSVAGTFVTGSKYLNRTVGGSPDYRMLSDRAAMITAPTEGVVVTGLGWSPEILYYANRWGVMADGNYVTAESVLRRPFVSRLTALVAVHGFDKVTRDLFSAANWVAPSDDYTFRMSLGSAAQTPPPIPTTGALPVVFTPRMRASEQGSVITLACNGITQAIDSKTFSVDADDPDAVFGGTGWMLPVAGGRFSMADHALRCMGPAQKSIQIRIIPSPPKQSVLP